MPVRGPLDHIDMSISDPERSIPFYAAFFGALGYKRYRSDEAGFGGPKPTRAAWFMRRPDGGFFALEVRPASSESRGRAHDRYAPGLHHLAFQAESRKAVDEIHEAMRAAGARVLDPPADYGGKPGYMEGYYAVFFADPDGIKLEVVYLPLTNP
jgi:catechol 2,3-dioxygenase-like lactoylglutathione lyase family enzyme